MDRCYYCTISCAYCLHVSLMYNLGNRTVDFQSIRPPHFTIEPSSSLLHFCCLNIQLISYNQLQVKLTSPGIKPKLPTLSCQLQLPSLNGCSLLYILVLLETAKFTCIYIVDQQLSLHTCNDDITCMITTNYRIWVPPTTESANSVFTQWSGDWATMYNEAITSIYSPHWL